MKIYDLPIESKDLSLKETQAITGGSWLRIALSSAQIYVTSDSIESYVTAQTGSVATSAVEGAKQAAKKEPAVGIVVIIVDNASAVLNAR